MELTSFLGAVRHLFALAETWVAAAWRWVILAADWVISRPFRPSVAVLLGAGLLALLLAFLLARGHARRAARPRRARALAAQGLSLSQIARQTGLSRDGVALTLAIASLTTSTRRKLPPTARFAGRKAIKAREAPRTSASQVQARSGVATDSQFLLPSAHRLPRRRARSFSLHS